MAYKLSDLKKPVPGIVDIVPGGPTTPHSPGVQRRLDLAVAVHEGYLTDHGTPSSEAALAQIAIGEMHREVSFQELGHTAIDIDSISL